MKVLEIYIEAFPGYEKVIESRCITGGKIISGVISNVCNFSVSNVTNIPIIDSTECFEKMKRTTGVANTNYTNGYNNICILSKDRLNYINNIIKNRILEASIIQVDEEPFNFGFFIQFFISALFISCIVMLMIKCFNNNRTNRIIHFPLAPNIVVEPQENRSPQREVKDVLATENDNVDCSICIEPIKSNSSIVKLPCGHIFHPECIKQWFQGSKRCPNCNDIGESNRIILPPIDLDDSNDVPLLES